MKDIEAQYGFTAVLASASKLLENGQPGDSAPYLPVTETAVPSTALAQRIQKYAVAKLPAPTYNHSMRVYHYGIAIKKYRFPQWEFTDETYFLACVLHDIGTTEENLHATKMSFEFYGGLVALDVLQQKHESGISPKEQAESVSEAIIRHQDLCEVGKITAVGQLLQLATIFDNTGNRAHLVHPDTIKDVVKHFPRLQWTNCFVSTIREENRLKPWAHTTALGEEEFPAMVLGNKLMREYEREE